MRVIHFDMPEPLQKKLEMQDQHRDLHQYLVTENGDLFVPWGADFIDESNDERVCCADFDGIMYFNSADLIKACHDEYVDDLRDMFNVMINFHHNRFDTIQERIES
jgi:hypothetical protein